jgi:hypothetical protein
MLLCIDFQPAYIEAFEGMMTPLRQRLRKASTRGEEVHFIYNEAYSIEGEELGDPVERVLAWSNSQKLPITNANALLLRKNFGWVSHLFREGEERAVAVSILKHLLQHGLNDSSEVSAPDLERIISSSHDDFEGFWDCSPAAWEEITSGAIAMPYLFEGGVLPWIESLAAKKSEVVEVIGGFRHRCRDEMGMLMEAGGISYRPNEELIYSVPEEQMSARPEAESWEPSEEEAPLLFSDFGLIPA